MDKIEQTIQSLILFLDGKSLFSAEEVSEKLNIPIKDIQRAIQQLRIRQGWSIQISNKTPYWRGYVVNYGPNTNRNREKGEKYEHDFAEPDWERTLYHILKKP